jgi:hypothetical protein
VVLDTRRSLVSAKGTRKPESTNLSQIRKGNDSDLRCSVFGSSTTKREEGTTDHKPPLRHRATWARWAGVRERERNGELGRQSMPTMSPK